jgi:hypothetical protein
MGQGECLEKCFPTRKAANRPPNRPAKGFSGNPTGKRRDEYRRDRHRPLTSHQPSPVQSSNAFAHQQLHPVAVQPPAGSRVSKRKRGRPTSAISAIHPSIHPWPWSPCPPCICFHSIHPFHPSIPVAAGGWLASF